MKSSHLPFIRQGLILLAGLLAGGGAARAADVAFPIVTDTYLDSYSPTSNLGASTSVKVLISSNSSACRGLFQLPPDVALLSTAKLPAAGDFADGVYRGSYMEDGEEEVAVEFTLENNVFSDVRYRALSYHGVDYLSPDAPEDAKRVAGQFEALLAHLQGQPVDAVNDLYQPGDIAPDVDGFSGATLRAPKVISAIWDALNRHAWHVE